ncbi:MAG: hypothetical protein HDT21_05550 [Ruminococcus sp.]|nr:hypothetical protein [Ruminococcus sp.]
MSEFCANSNFLDRKHFFTKYYLLIKDISFGASDVESAMNKLKNYSGFGIEEQVANLKKCHTQLRDYREDVRTEFYALVKIVDTINDCDNRAKGILEANKSSISESIITAISDNENNKRNLVKEIGNWIQEFFSSLAEDDQISKFVDDNNPISVMKYIKLLDKIINYYKDGIHSKTDWLIDGLKVDKSAISANKAFYKVLEKLSLVPKASENSSLWGKSVEYAPVANVILDTLISGVESYNKYSADGDFTFAEGNEMVLDASIDGLSACIAGFIGLIPVVGPAGSTIYTLADEKYGFTESAKNGIKDFGKGQAADIYESIYSNDNMSEFYDNANPVTQVFVRCMLLNPTNRKIIRTGKFSLI